MLDLTRIRKEPEVVATALLKRGLTVDFTHLLAIDQQRRALSTEADTLKAQRNQLSALVPRMKKAGEDTAPLFENVRNIGEAIKALDAQSEALLEEQTEILAALPNLPDDDVVAGDKENNQVVHTWGDKPVFDFEPKDHVTLSESLHLIDYPRGAKLGGAGKWVYTGNGAKLEWALLNYFISEHLKDHYTFMLVPHILNYEAGFAAGQFPKFEGDVFWIGDRYEPCQQFVLPTAETALVNLHRNELLREEDLPKKYFAYTPCYRREAGSYRAEERGMIRGNQFNKVEMVQYALPEDSPRAFAEMVEKAERLVRGLGLHYQLSKLAAGDVSASMARTFDIEVWLPSMGIYKEVSSASNSNDYQARRGQIRVKRKADGRNEFVHILNASGLATSRVFPAILEQHQQKDGSVKVPDALVPFYGDTFIRP